MLTLSFTSWPWTKSLEICFGRMNIPDTMPLSCFARRGVKTVTPADPHSSAVAQTVLGQKI
jgi:hypothetical protein